MIIEGPNEVAKIRVLLSNGQYMVHAAEVEHIANRRRQLKE